MAEQGSRVGTQFGPYRLDALLGSGGMGEVYRAHDTVRDREVAVKLLHERFTGDDTYEERFRREAQAVAKLGEPHIIPIHDYGEIDGVLYLDMRLVEGEDLRARLRRTGPLTSADASGIVGQIANALDAAHAVGLVHRDVKPENVLVTSTDFAYLVDFGIAHQTADTRLTQTGTAIGSLAYMAPEQLDGIPTNAASDVYSLAAVTFEMLTGMPPFPGATVSQIVRATVMNEVPSPRQHAPTVSPQVDAVVVRGLAKEQGSRFSSAGAFATALREACDGHWPDAGTAPTSTMPTGAAFDATMLGQRPLSLVKQDGHGHVGMQASGPQSVGSQSVGSQYQGQQYPGQQYSGPQYVGPQYSGPQYSGQQFYADGTGYGEPEEGGRALQVVLGALIGLLVLALIGMAVYWFGFRDPGATQTGSPSSTTTLTQTVEPTQAPANPTPPADTMMCGSDVGVSGGVTSCAFAFEVRNAYLASGAKGAARTVVASSPVTQTSYSMSCNPETGVVVCRGGNNAVVVIF